MATFAPSRANASAVARPMPESAPVTIATFPSSLIAMGQPAPRGVSPCRQAGDGPGSLNFSAISGLSRCHRGGAMARDRIEKQAVLHAPVERVWQALSDAGKFGEWFGVQFEGPFEAGKRMTGRIVPTRVDRE